MESLRIVHLFPDLLNLYGDGGNVRCLQKRCEWRGIPVQVEKVNYGERTNLEAADIVFLGGGPDREQKLASGQLLNMKDQLRDFVEHDGVLLAICGGFQILGHRWLLGDESVEGLGIVDMETRRSAAQKNRLIDNVVLKSRVCAQPVVGYENHAGRTYLGSGVQPFGMVVSATGHGNNDEDRQDGVLYRGVLGTYLHGPLLGKNPQVADYLLRMSSDQRLARGKEGFDLAPLDDSVEQAANAYMAKRLKVSE